MQEEDRRWRPSWLRPLVAGLKALGSIQLAVTLIAICVVVLVWGTRIESRSGAEAARSTVYGTWWFTALNALLAVNVLLALLVRFPWRRRQTGFVLMHVGILVLLAGCLATRQWGVEAQLSVYEGHASHVADEDSHPLNLGFQVYLRKFQRKLDPGSDMPSHYSSRVDFLALSNPPKKPQEEKKLRENVLITLNSPVDFTDPRSGRTYRLFQADKRGPWLPGDPEFDRLVGNDHSRDQVYLSVFSVNYDPGRGLKYAGCLMIVVGIGVVYYWRRLGRNTLNSACGFATARRAIVFAIAICSAGVCRGEDRTELDWSAWRRLPAFGQGRIMPLDTFARETVEAVCGREEPTLPLGNDRWPTFSAAELLFSWLAEPEKWEHVPFLVAEDKQLRRDVLGLPLTDASGRRLRYASPVEVENSAELGRRWEELGRQEEAAGAPPSPTGVDKSLTNLVEAYVTYRQLTFNPTAPKDTPRRFFARVRSSADAWRKLAADLQAARRITREPAIRDEMVAAGDALQKIIATMHGGEFSLVKVESPVTAFCRAGERLAARLANSDDKPLAALAANLGRQTAEMHLALYDNGGCLRLVPALDAGALEENRTPGDDASPWLSFQAMTLGSNDLLHAYPQIELRAVRQAFADVKAAYASNGGADIPVRPGQTRMSAPPTETFAPPTEMPAPPSQFAAAMDRFAQSLRDLAAKIGPLRAKLPIQHLDQELMASTAYPPPGSTDAEVFYNRLDPFFWSWIVSLAATLGLLLAVSRWQKPVFWLGIAVLLAAQCFTATGMGLRAYITGLVPLTGMFETVVFVALYAALVGLWFTLKPLLRLCVPLLETTSVRDRSASATACSKQWHTTFSSGGCLSWRGRS